MRLNACALALLSSAACSTEPRFALRNESCPAIFPDLGLSTLIDGGGGGGDFDVDPPGALGVRAFGNYELATGDFVYTQSYAADYYIDVSRVEGYGYAAPNGDLDIEATWTDTDVLDADATYMVREQRAGCGITRTTLYQSGAEEILEGTYGGNTLGFTTTTEIGMSEPLVFEGTVLGDLSSTSSADFDADGLEYRVDSTDDGQGNVRNDWFQSQAGDTYEGYDETTIDGTTHTWYEGSGSVDFTWETTVDYAGNGGGSYSTSDGTCSVAYSAWVCTYDCGGGESGQC